MKKDKYKIVLILIFVIAILVRIDFIGKTNIATYQFDVGIQRDYSLPINYEELYDNFDKGCNEGRHINYIMQLYKYGTLPTKIIGQFYHPPLHHLIMAMNLKVMDMFSDSASLKFESMQFITFIYSVVILVILYKMLEELGLQDKNKILPMLLFACYPLYIFLSGSINNDELVTMFALICLLYLMKWKKNPSLKNTIIIAISMGLGLMTKSSMYVMIIPAVYVYFKVLIEHVNCDKKIGNLLLELILFCIIAGTLGFWFQVRSYMNGLDTLGIIEPYEYLSIANKSLIERFCFVSPFEMSDVNIWNNLMYTSLNFGILNVNKVYINIMIILLIALIIDVLYFIFKDFEKDKILIVSFVAWWCFYFFLNIQMPYTCSMHSRYMIVPISIATLILAQGMKEEKNKMLKLQVYITTISICVMSLGMFIFII
ncbi:MAG: glycosyltransferase family 39 protein [Clostridia bacterium]|nr:glycosyltransferase family 39 protein [Clostridia bacterium]